MSADVDDRLAQLAANDSPPTELGPYLARLRAGGATTVAFMEELGDVRNVVVATGRGVQVFAEVDPQAGTAPTALALEELASELQRFDRVRRLRLAASDMEIAEHTAEALIDARENDGIARLFERVLETGLIVTFTRPYLDSNQAGLPKRYHPKLDDDRALLEYVEELRDVYHAHAGHTARRQIIDGSPHFGMNKGKPTYVEAWETLSVAELRQIADLARRQAAELAAAADDLQRELND